jgi:hypothetical protein
VAFGILRRSNTGSVGFPSTLVEKNCTGQQSLFITTSSAHQMVLWLGEASGIPPARVAEAKRAALSASPRHLPALSAAIRKLIPWEMIEVRLDKSGR